MASSDSIREDPTENSGACHKVLSLARRSLIASGSLDSAVALSLEAAFGEETLTGALQILDYKPSAYRVKKEGPSSALTSDVASPSVSAPVLEVTAEKSGRKFWAVRDSRGLRYTVLPSSNFCCCTAWIHLTYHLGLLPTCKHVLAANLVVVDEQDPGDQEHSFPWMARIMESDEHKFNEWMLAGMQQEDGVAKHPRNLDA